jgi:hypothetical protein
MIRKNGEYLEITKKKSISENNMSINEEDTIPIRKRVI